MNGTSNDQTRPVRLATIATVAGSGLDFPDLRVCQQKLQYAENMSNSKTRANLRDKNRSGEGETLETMCVRLGRKILDSFQQRFP